VPADRPTAKSSCMSEADSNAVSNPADRQSAAASSRPDDLSAVFFAAQSPNSITPRGSFGEVGVIEFGLKDTSRVCRGRHREVGIVEFGLNPAA